jgi:precorrin-3B C17-methyltransferase
MAEQDIGMLSTVLIGNGSTFVRDGLMVTPRGYANKYDMDDGGATRDGEKAGRSLSTGLLGWLDALQADHAAGESVEQLAARHRLPLDYIRATLDEPLEAAATDLPEESQA